MDIKSAKIKRWEVSSCYILWLSVPVRSVGNVRAVSGDNVTMLQYSSTPHIIPTLHVLKLTHPQITSSEHRLGFVTTDTSREKEGKMYIQGFPFEKVGFSPLFWRLLWYSEAVFSVNTFSRVGAFRWAQPDVAVALAQPDIAVALVQPDVAVALAQPDVAVALAQSDIH